MQKIFKILFSRDEILFWKFLFFTLHLIPTKWKKVKKISQKMWNFFIFLQNLQRSYMGRKPKQNTKFSFTRTKIKVTKIKNFVKIVKKCVVIYRGEIINVKNENFENQICSRENEIFKNFCIFGSNFLQKNFLFCTTLG